MDLTGIGRLGAAGYIKRRLISWEAELEAALSGLSADGGTYTGIIAATGTLAGTVMATAGVAEHGDGALGAGGLISVSRRSENGTIITERTIDITGMSAAGNTAADAIGVSGTDPSFIGKYVVATDGIVYKVEMVCLEAAVGGDTDIDLGINSVGTVYIDGAVDTVLLDTGTPAPGESYENLLPALTEGHYYYLVENGGTAAIYTAGQFLIRTYGHAALA